MGKDIIREEDDFFREEDLSSYGGDVQITREMNRLKNTGQIQKQKMKNFRSVKVLF